VSAEPIKPVEPLTNTFIDTMLTPSGAEGTFAR
jgi:hypothetical protein